MESLVVSEARLAYELHLGRRVSDKTWYQVRKHLELANYEVNLSTAVLYARLKKQIPRSSLSPIKVLECYRKAEELLSESATKIKGVEIAKILTRQNINPHQSTFSRWFKKLGGFKRSRLYLASELTPILTAALVYKASQQPKANPGKKPEFETLEIESMKLN